MEWYGKEHLQPSYTKKLMNRWQGLAANIARQYYTTFPELYPKHLPDDHYIVKYDETKFPTNRDYRDFKSCPPAIISTHRIEWENGYGPCNVCSICIKAREDNDKQMTDYYRRLEAWKKDGVPM